jgi:hypothetical protein
MPNTSSQTPLVSPDLVKSVEGTAALMSKANALALKTAYAVLESQSDFFHHEAACAAAALAPPSANASPDDTLKTYLNQCRAGADGWVSHMRRVNDLIADCGWTVMKAYADNLIPGASASPRNKG